MDMPHSRMPFLFYLYFCKFTKIFRVGKSLAVYYSQQRVFLLPQHSFSTVSHTYFRCATHSFQMCYTLISDVLHTYFRCATHLFQMCYTLISDARHTLLRCATHSFLFRQTFPYYAQSKKISTHTTGLLHTHTATKVFYRLT